METSIYYVIKPTTHKKKKAAIGSRLELTEAEARPLRNGGFLTTDVLALNRIAELAHTLSNLEYDLQVVQEERKQAEDELKKALSNTPSFHQDTLVDSQEGS